MAVTAFEDEVCEAVSRLARGAVVSYGEIAAQLGRPGAARAVGTVLARTSRSVPWWRVVSASGRLVPGHEREHARLLRAEGVTVFSGRVRAAGAGPDRDRSARVR